MRRWLCIAAFNLILLALPAWAQHGGGHASGGGSAFHSSASHSSGFTSHSSGFASHSFGSGISAGMAHTNGYARAGSRSFSRNAGSRVRIGDRHFGGRDFDRHRFRGWQSFYPYYAYYPYGFYDPYYSGYMGSEYQGEGDSAGADAGQYYAAPAREREGDGLQRDVQTLSGKIDRLQADVEARNRPRTEQEPMTALVFRDQHVEEVRNYAISGGTLWVLNEQAAKKIPLAQLDLDATARMNDNRGVDFQVPK